MPFHRPGCTQVSVERLQVIPFLHDKTNRNNTSWLYINNSHWMVTVRCSNKLTIAMSLCEYIILYTHQIDKPRRLLRFCYLLFETWILSFWSMYYYFSTQILVSSLVIQKHTQVCAALNLCVFLYNKYITLLFAKQINIPNLL